MFTDVTLLDMRCYLLLFSCSPDMGIFEPNSSRNFFNWTVCWGVPGELYTLFSVGVGTANRNPLKRCEPACSWYTNIESVPLQHNFWATHKNNNNKLRLLHYCSILLSSTWRQCRARQYGKNIKSRLFTWQDHNLHLITILQFFMFV